MIMLKQPELESLKICEILVILSLKPRAFFIQCISLLAFALHPKSERWPSLFAVVVADGTLKQTWIGLQGFTISQSSPRHSTDEASGISA